MVNQTCEKCGKTYLSKGYKTHIKFCKGETRVGEESKDPSKGQKVQEINLMSEFENKKTTIEPQKQKASEQEENNYKCGSCQEEFYSKKRPNHCPNCGCEF